MRSESWDDGASQRGLGFALAILALWLASHIASVFYFDWQASPLALVPFMVVWLVWLYVGLFIIAHDCMHGSLTRSPRANRILGRLCLMLYAAFDFDAMLEKHRAHHRFAGTGDDPDYYAGDPRDYSRWYVKFFREYSSLKQYASIAALSWAYVLLFGVPLANVLVFWALPAILSSLQLFTFGTYLPHRPGDEPFADEHRARSNDFPRWLSLLTCFHFGYHHEHHARPSLPWWRLPDAREQGEPPRVTR